MVTYHHLNYFIQMRFDLQLLYLSNDANIIHMGEKKTFLVIFVIFYQYLCDFNEFIGTVGRFRFYSATFLSPGSFLDDISESTSEISDKTNT